MLSLSYLDPELLFTARGLVLLEGAEGSAVLCLDVSGEFAGRTVFLSFKTESTDGESKATLNFVAEKASNFFDLYNLCYSTISLVHR